MTIPLAFWVALLWSSTVLSRLVNRTVDDTLPDPVTGAQVQYYSSDSSLTWGNYASCDGCTAKPDRGQAYNGTWHDSTFDPTHTPLPNVTASLTFSGTAVYVYCIVPSSSQSPNGFADITFYIDGRPSGVYTKTPPGNAGYDYSTMAFAQTGITAGEHTLMIQNGRAETKSRSLILLDYITYTTDDGQHDQSSSQSSNSQNDTNNLNDQNEGNRISVGTIAGIAVGALVLAVIIALGAFLLWRKRRRASRSHELKFIIDSEDPFTGPGVRTVPTRPGLCSVQSENVSTVSMSHASIVSSNPCVGPSSVLSNRDPFNGPGSVVLSYSPSVSTGHGHGHGHDHDHIAQVPRDAPPHYTESEHGSSVHDEPMSTTSGQVKRS